MLVVFVDFVHNLPLTVSSFLQRPSLKAARPKICLSLHEQLINVYPHHICLQSSMIAILEDKSDICQVSSKLRILERISNKTSLIIIDRAFSHQLVLLRRLPFVQMILLLLPGSSQCHFERVLQNSASFGLYRSSISEANDCFGEVDFDVHENAAVRRLGIVSCEIDRGPQFPQHFDIVGSMVDVGFDKVKRVRVSMLSVKGQIGILVQDVLKDILMDVIDDFINGVNLDLTRCRIDVQANVLSKR